MIKQFKRFIDDAKLYYGAGITHTLNKFSNEINKLLVDREFFDEDFFEDFEEKLIELDVLPKLALILRMKLEDKIYNKHVNKESFQEAMNEVIADTVNMRNETLELDKNQLNVLLVVGVNGVGKTTSISKLVNQYKADYDILLAAGDTFRAGAIAQLASWADRLDVPIEKTHEGHAPSAVVYNAMDRAIADQKNLLICDTAGRLHNKDELMNELAKIHKIITTKVEENDNLNLKTILVLDGTAGKNTIEQAKIFNSITKLDGVIVTKLDSGGKAGMILNISYEIDVPIYFLTTGEAVEDIRPFDMEPYLQSLFS